MNLLDKAEDKSKKFIIALDGPSAAGKGTIGRMIAKEFAVEYVQSSIVYRGLAYVCIEDNVNIDDVRLVTKISKNTNILSRIKGVDLQIEEIGDIASKIAVIPEVRENLNLYLKKVILNAHRIVMEGRDIGTVVAPEADLKLFITADVNIRAQRRFKQLRSEGKECIMSDILNLMKKRDDLDQTRKVAPLEVADGALVIDTTNLSPPQVIQKIKNFVAK